MNRLALPGSLSESSVISTRKTRPWLLLAGLATAAIMDTVNSTVITVARAQMMGATHATPDEIAWVNMTYLMAKLSAFPVAAWLALRFGAGRVLAVSMLLVLAGSLGSALTHDLEPLVASRIVQGAAGGVMLAAGQSLLFEVFPPRRQGLVQALFALSIIMGPTTIAPALQGWITDELSWSWTFFLNLPAGLLGLLALALGIPADAGSRPVGRFDWPGLVLVSIAMGCLVFVLQEGNRYDWFEEPEIVHLTLVGLIATGVFIAWEIRTQGRGALIDLRVFHDQHFAFGFIVSFVAGFALFGSAFVIPAFALGVLHYSPTQAGLLLLPSGLLVGFGHLAAGGLIQFRNVAPFKLIPIGILCFMTGMWFLTGATVESGAPDMMPGLLVRGLGLGLLFVAITMVTLGSLEGSLVAHGVALFNFGRQFGGLIGIATMQTYLHYQNALNLSVLSRFIAPGNPALAEREAMITARLEEAGYSAIEAASTAAAVLQRTLQAQVAVLSFNEAFFAIALLFVAAAPLLVATNLILGRLVPSHHT